MVEDATFVHEPRLLPPWYLPTGGTALHRYLDDDFVERFLDDLHEHRLSSAELTAWQGQDFFRGRTDHVTLRQPAHRTFYMLSCEVACERLGFPAFDRNKMRSTGYVIRRVPSPAGPQAWRITNGRAIRGWAPADVGIDPDESRRSNPALAGFASQAAGGTPSDGHEPLREPAYNGEQVHPLHSVTLTDEGGKRRTVLFGFLSISGGTATIARPTSVRQIDDSSPAARAVLRELPKPFGSSTRDALTTSKMVVREGYPSNAFIALLRILVQRYRIGFDEPDAANASLEAELESWKFDSTPLTSWFDDIGPERRIVAPLSVLAWLKASLKLVELAKTTDPAADDYGEPAPTVRPLLQYLGKNRTESVYLNDPLPAEAGVLTFNLHLDTDRLSRLQQIIVRRAASLVDRIAQEVPIPRFGHGDDDIYVAIPFVRYCHHGQERIAWGPPSQAFRVASVYSAEAARPTLIPLPSLKDLVGKPTAGFLAPQDLARKLLGLKQVDDKMQFSDGNGPTFGLCWLFGFSIPAITICAFVILFIILNLLNLIFWWLPFVFLKIPFPCRLVPPPPPPEPTG